MSETTAKNNRKFIPLAIKRTLLLLLFALAVQMGINAEEIKGIIRNVEVFSVPISGVHPRLEISVGANGKRIPDYVLTFPDPAWGWSRDFRAFAERGMEVVFDNVGSIVAPDGTKIVSGDNSISIDGVNMLDLFPNERARFKFAAAVYDRERSQSNAGGRSDRTSIANLPPPLPVTVFQKRERED